MSLTQCVAEETFTPEDFRAVMGRLVAGVTVVTADGPHGTTVNETGSEPLAFHLGKFRSVA